MLTAAASSRPCRVCADRSVDVPRRRAAPASVEIGGAAVRRRRSRRGCRGRAARAFCDLVAVLASVCTVLSGTCVPELLGLMSPSSVANAIASASEASSRNSASGSRKTTRARALRELAEGHEHRVAPVRQARAHGRLARGAAVAGAVGCERSRAQVEVGLVCHVVVVRRPGRSTGCDRVAGRRRSAADQPRSAARDGASVTRRARKCNAVHKNDT